MIEEQIIMDGYTDFVEKFKPKKTTDDCYTPEPVYDAVAEWVALEYGLDRERFARPFWPGADYERESYPEGCVVVDNPPFSILSKILAFYRAHGVRYFLFAPALTAMGAARNNGACLIAAGCGIIYANGANVNTSFVTNLEPGVAARSAPDLHRLLKEANRQPDKTQAKYSYPDAVCTGAMLNYLSAHGEALRIRERDSYLIGAMDSQKAAGKTIFGAGLLLSEKAAAEKAAAEKAAAEKAAATQWALSDRERAIQKAMEALG